MLPLVLLYYNLVCLYLSKNNTFVARWFAQYSDYDDIQKPVGLLQGTLVFVWWSHLLDIVWDVFLIGSFVSGCKFSALHLALQC